MVKIPATQAGLAAIQHMIGEGKHTNVTLTFSVGRYAEVVEAYLSGLDDLRKRGGGLSRLAGVASFFVSRVDTKVGKLLNARIQATNDARVKLEVEELYGRTGIANSKIAYQRYQELFSGPRWEALQRASARVQRCVGEYVRERPAVSRHNVRRGAERGRIPSTRCRMRPSRHFETTRRCGPHY